MAVMGHVGLLPQSISVLGGFGPQGKSAENALRVLDDAKVSCAETTHAATLPLHGGAAATVPASGF